MSYENIRFDKNAFCAAGEYFVSFIPSPTNMMIQKTSNGDPVMTYPFSHELTVVENDFLSMQFDGVNYWTLEKYTYGGSNEKRRVLRRWRVEDKICNLKNSWLIKPAVAENMSGVAFAVENYANYTAKACGPGTFPGPGTGPLAIELVHPHAAFFQYGDQLHIESADGEYSQDIAVASISTANVVNLSSALTNVYYAGSKVYLRRAMYFFNDESPALGAASAAVYHFRVPYGDATDPSAIDETGIVYYTCHDSGIYQGTTAATFITTSGHAGINDGNYTGAIAYIRGMQMLMKQPNMPVSPAVPYPGGYNGTNTEIQSNIASMLIDNAIKIDRVSLHTIYDLSGSVSETECRTINIYRLQRSYTYGAIEGTWTTANYVVSVMEPMVTSIGLTAEPALVVANGSDSSMIAATVRDQYGAPINYKRVVFEIVGTGNQRGYFVCPEEVSECVAGSFTWLDSVPHRKAEVITGSQSAYPGGPPAMGGQAIIKWRAGTEAGLVTITATVQP